MKTEDERRRTVTAESDAAEAEVDRTRKREAKLLAAAIKRKEEEAANNMDVDEGMDDTPPTANDDPEVDDTGAGAGDSNVNEGARKKARKDRKKERKAAKRAREQEATTEKFHVPSPPAGVRRASSRFASP